MKAKQNKTETVSSSHDIRIFCLLVKILLSIVCNCELITGPGVSFLNRETPGTHLCVACANTFPSKPGTLYANILYQYISSKPGTVYASLFYQNLGTTYAIEIDVVVRAYKNIKEGQLI